MIILAEQLSLATKAVFDTQLASATAFSQAAFHCGVTMIDLNVDAAMTCMAAYTVAAKQLLSVKDSQEWMSTTASQSQLALDRVHAYGRQAAELAQDAQANFSRVAESEIAASQQIVIELVDVVKRAPTVAAMPINSFLKTAFQTAHEGYDNFTSPVRASVESLPSGSGAERSECAPL